MKPLVERLRETVSILRQRRCGIHAGWVQEAIGELEKVQGTAKEQSRTVEVNPDSSWVSPSTVEKNERQPTENEGTMLDNLGRNYTEDG